MAHTEELLCGFIELARRGEVRLRLERTGPPRPGRQHVLNGVVAGARVVYDMHDGYMTLADGSYDAARFATEVAGVDYYFKRSYDPGLHAGLPHAGRVRPLGLNFKVPPAAPLIPWGLRAFDPRRFAKWALHWDPSLAELERPPAATQAPTVLFQTRVWDPEGATCQAEADAREEINDRRAECVRAARAAFGDIFEGGLIDEEFARRRYPDCLMSHPDRKGRRSYLRRMHGATICVATTGLHRSIGWKLAEYVAASRAIVSEPLEYEVPGPFAAGGNYLEFASVDGFVSAVTTLLDDADRRRNMMQANWEYYTGWVRPDSLVMNTLLQVVGRPPLAL